MTYEWRSPRDYFFATLSNPAAISDTTISSTSFVGLPTTYSTSLYLPLVLHDPSRGVYEVVWATGHTTGSANVTIVRGREGSTAQAWPGGTQVAMAPSSRDLVPALTRATLPADPHQGMRALLTDESVVVERTLAGWGPSVGVANPGDVGPNVNAGTTYPPANSVIQLRAGWATYVTDASGNATVAYRTPFLTSTIAITITSNDFRCLGPYVIYASDLTGFSLTSYSGSTVRLNAIVCSISYIAIGY